MGQSVGRPVLNSRNEHVVGPAGNDVTDGGNGNIIYQEHHYGKNRQCQHSVGYDPVDFIGQSQLLVTLFSFNCFWDHAVDVLVALVDDDALRIVVHFFFAVLDVTFNLAENGSAQLDFFPNLLIPFEEFDGVPSQVVCRHLVFNGFLDVCDGVLHAAGVHVRGVSHGSLLCHFDRLINQLLAAVSLESTDRNDWTAQLFAQLRDVDAVSVLIHDVHHVQCDDGRNVQLQQLCGEIQVSLQVGGVDDVDDGIRSFVHQVLPGDHFLHGVRGKGIDSRKVLNCNGFVSL